jgi:hypothetical protein
MISQKTHSKQQQVPTALTASINLLHQVKQQQQAAKKTCV